MTTLGINTFSHYRRTEGRPLVGGRWLVNSILPLFPVTYLLGMLTMLPCHLLGPSNHEADSSF